MVDPDGTIVLANSGMERIFGYTAQELVGSSLELLIPESSRTSHKRLRTHYLSSPEERIMGSGRELNGRRKDGEEIPIEIGLNPLQRPEGDLVVASVVDVSRRRRTERELASTHADLQQLTYGISHELKAPLRSISGFVQILAERYGDSLDSKAHDLIQRSVNAVERLHNQVNQLLSLTEMDAETRPFSSVDLNRVMARARAILDPTIERIGASLSCSELPSVQGDEGQLLQIFLNIMANSFSYHREGERPNLQITSLDSGSHQVICFKDRGQGIPQEDWERVFKVFERANANKQPGGGIGLALCRRIAMRHGGHVWIESSSTEGSDIRLSIGKLDDEH